jgi:uncharacterized protein DUF4118
MPGIPIVLAVRVRSQGARGFREEDVQLVDARAPWCYHGGVRFIGLGRSRDRVAIVAALLVPLGVAAVLVPFRTTLPSTVAVLLLVTVVVAVAANGYRGAGWLAAVSAALWFDFFLTRPYERFAITHRADIETTVMLLVVGAAVTELAVRGRWHHHVAQLEAGYLVAIRTTADLVASGASSFQVVSLVKDQLTELLSLRECRFERGRFGGLPRLEADGDVHLGEVQWDVERAGFPATPVEVRTTSNGRAYGRFLITVDPHSRPGVLPRQVVVILADLVGTALARETRSPSARSHRAEIG